MKQQTSVKQNMILNATLAVTSMIIPMITFPYITRVLKPTGYGRVQFVSSVIAYFTMLAGMGIQTYATRECAKVRDDRIKLSRLTKDLLLLNTVTMAVSYAALFLFVVFVPRAKGSELLYFILGLGILFECLGAEWLFTAKELFTYKTFRTLFFHVAALVATFLFIRESTDVVMYAILLALPTIGNGLVNMVTLRKHVSLSSAGPSHPFIHLKPVLVFFALVATTKIYLNLDMVMLGFMKDDVQVGYYSASVKIKTVLVALVTSISAVLLPRTSSYAEKGLLAELKLILAKAMHAALILSIAGTAFFFLFADETIMILAGKEFLPSVISMRIILPAIIFIAATDIMGLQLLVPLGHEKKVVHSVIAGAVIDLIINLILIPGYGAAGAAIGTLAAELVVFAVQYIITGKLGFRLFKDIQLPTVLFSSTFALILSLAAKLLIPNYVMRFFIGGIVYLIGDALMLVLLKDRLVNEVLRSLIGRLRKTHGV